MTLTPSRRVYGLGAILLASLFVCARSFSRPGGASFLVPLAVASVAYLLAIREFFASAQLPRHVVIVGLALAALWHLPFMRAPSRPDDDIRRYVWDGRVQRLGYDPHLLVPNDPAATRLHTAETRTLNNPEVPSPYPAGAELFFRLVTAAHESAFALKLAFLLCEVATVLVLAAVLRWTQESPHWVLAYAWHPLLATEVAGSGHVDVVGALVLLVSFAALLRGWRALAAVTLGLAISVKLLPVVLLPVYWNRVRVRDAILAIAAVGVLYVPFLKGGWLPIGSLGTYVQRFRFNDPVFAAVGRVSAPQLAAGLAVIVGFSIATWLRSRSPALAAEAFAWPMAGSLLCAPVVYPWYLLWTLPFLRSASTVPIVIWTVSIIPTYVVWHLRELGRPWVVPGWVTVLEFGPVAIATAIVAFRGDLPGGVRPPSRELGVQPSARRGERRPAAVSCAYSSDGSVRRDVRE